MYIGEGVEADDSGISIADDFPAHSIALQSLSLDLPGLMAVLEKTPIG